MGFKSLDKLFTASGGIFIVRNRNRSLLFKSRLLVSQKTHCHSKTNNEDSEEHVKKLLDESSPLKPVQDDFLGTDADPEGTVFQKSQSEPLIFDNPGSVIMFPGQGNQFVGMAKNLLQYNVVQDMFNAASDILKYDLLKVCLEGPEGRLNRTEYCQPATYVCSLGALEKLKDEKPWAISNCIATCGYSLGEISSLVFAGVIKFEEGLRLIKCRAEAMELCCQKTPGGMMSVLFGPKVSMGKAFEDAVQHCLALGIENPECKIAVHLLPYCKVIAGNKEALNFLVQNSKKYGFKRLSKLPVSGAFHTGLMKGAAEPVKKFLNSIKLNEPLIKVYSNISGKSYVNAEQIKKKIPEQIYKTVKWEQTMTSIFQREQGTPFPYSYECGPGNSLSVALRKINNAASKSCYNVRL